MIKKNATTDGNIAQKINIFKCKMWTNQIVIKFTNSLYLKKEKGDISS